MNRKKDIRLISDIVKRTPFDIPKAPGIYAFWWMGDIHSLLHSNTKMVLAGPGGADVEVNFTDWWPKNLPYPSLYVGKSTNIKKRFGQHLKRGCKGRLHNIPASSKKQKAVTTSCQLRYGIEHLFPSEPLPLDIINENIGFSYEVMDADAIAERFYREDELIGRWRPWINVDSER